MLQSRRLFLSSAVSLLAAPAIVQASNLMPIYPHWMREHEFFESYNPKNWMYSYNKLCEFSGIDIIDFFNPSFKKPLSRALYLKDLNRIPVAKSRFVKIPQRAPWFDQYKNSPGSDKYMIFREGKAYYPGYWELARI